MKHLTQNIEVAITSNDLTANEKINAVKNELQQTFYSDEEYDEAKYWKWISIFDTGMWVEDADERNNTSLDPLYLEEWIDVELLCRVRQLHNGIKEPDEVELANFDKLDDCLSINYSGRDKRKFAVMNTPGYETKYHMLPGGWMVASLVKSNSPYTRKVVWNEEWNFEEIIDNDKPDWLVELEEKDAKTKKFKKQEHQMKILRKQIRDLRKKYKHYYNKYGITKNMDDKKKWDEYYKEYLHYSKVMDKIKELDAKIDYEIKQREANILLHYFVEFQQKAPADVIERVTRDDIKAKCKATWYHNTLNFLKKCVKRANELAVA